jgi:ketosteroid isomerase-like protein
MSSENVEIVQRLYEAFARRDVPEILSRLAPEVEISQSTDLPWGGVYQGADQFGLFFRNLTQHIHSTLVFERYLDSGDHVVAIGRTQGTVAATGHPFDVPIMHLWRLREGKVLSFQPYIDNPAMQAVLATEGAVSGSAPRS